MNNFNYIIIIQNSYIYIILININYNKSTFILIHFLKIVLSSLLWILFVFLWLSYFNQFIESFEQTSFIMYNILFYNYFIKLLFLKKVRNVIPNTKFFPFFLGNFITYFIYIISSSFYFSFYFYFYSYVFYHFFLSVAKIMHYFFIKLIIFIYF